MEIIEFSIKIHASKQNVWASLWDEANYPKWTSVFGEGNRAIGDWNEGSKIHFIAKDGGGLFSVIENKVIYEQIIFKHLGELKNGEEIINEWAGAKEKYFLTEVGNTTELKVEMDIKTAYKDYFIDTFPKALQIVKQISENNQ
ncbi:SRPBCC domain-containing protein [soil metagenome]